MRASSILIYAAPVEFWTDRAAFASLHYFKDTDVPYRTRLHQTQSGLSQEALTRVYALPLGCTGSQTSGVMDPRIGIRELRPAISAACP